MVSRPGSRVTGLLGMLLQGTAETYTGSTAHVTASTLALHDLHHVTGSQVFWKDCAGLNRLWKSLPNHVLRMLQSDVLLHRWLILSMCPFLCLQGRYILHCSNAS